MVTLLSLISILSCCIVTVYKCFYPLIFDVSYLEIYADGGLETASVCVYPDAPYQVVSTDGDLEVKMYTIKK